MPSVVSFSVPRQFTGIVRVAHSSNLHLTLEGSPDEAAELAADGVLKKEMGFFSKKGTQTC